MWYSYTGSSGSLDNCMSDADGKVRSVREKPGEAYLQPSSMSASHS